MGGGILALHLGQFLFDCLNSIRTLIFLEQDKPLEWMTLAVRFRYWAIGIDLYNLQENKVWILILLGQDILLVQGMIAVEFRSWATGSNLCKL